MSSNSQKYCCEDVTLADVTGSLTIESTRKQYSRTLKELAPFVKANDWVEGGRMDNLTDENSEVCWSSDGRKGSICIDAEDYVSCD